VYVTLGSPLAITAIERMLAPVAIAPMWFNARERSRRVVALYPLHPAHFGLAPAVENKNDVGNQTSNRHGNTAT
jgi:hypothetical protein